MGWYAMLDAMGGCHARTVLKIQHFFKIVNFSVWTDVLFYMVFVVTLIKP